MGHIELRDIIAAAIVIPVVSLMAVWTAKKLGRWIVGSLEQSFGKVVLDVMAPDMAHLSTKVTSSLDELRTSNTADHTVVQQRLADVEARLAKVEARLGFRTTDARTRHTDQET